MCYFFILSWDNDFVVRVWGHTGHFVSESYTQFVDSASLVPFGCNVDLKDWPVDVDLGLSRLWIPLAPDWRVYLQYTLSQYFAHNPQHATNFGVRSFRFGPQFLIIPWLNNQVWCKFWFNSICLWKFNLHFYSSQNTPVKIQLVIRFFYHQWCITGLMCHKNYSFVWMLIDWDHMLSPFN